MVARRELGPPGGRIGRGPPGKKCLLYWVIFATFSFIRGQWHSEGAGGAAAPGRRPEGGAKILPRIFFNLYIKKFKKSEKIQ